MPGFFTCTAWLTVDSVFQCHPCSAVVLYEKACLKVRQATSVLWPSMLLPTPLSLPKHSIPPQPSPRLKENTHTVCQKMESDHRVREEWMLWIVWHWNYNSLSFSKRVNGSLYIHVPLLYLHDQGLILGHTFQSTQLCRHWIWSRWKDINRKWISLIVVCFHLLSAPVHIEQISKWYPGVHNIFLFFLCY